MLNPTYNLLNLSKVFCHLIEFIYVCPEVHNVE
jgi:hypothetical protein